MKNEPYRELKRQKSKPKSYSWLAVSLTDAITYVILLNVNFHLHMLKKYLSLFILLSFIACGAEEEEIAETEKVLAQKGISYSDSTLQTIQQLLKNYYAVIDALVKSDSLSASNNASVLHQVALAADLATVKDKDSATYVTALETLNVIITSSQSLHTTHSLEQQRVIFETISDNLYELVAAMKPAGVATYKQYCPMAFNDKGAYWLSDTSLIQNPYFGKKMLKCGEVREELRYQ
jgi:Cu(I)/Ag(I) efflux system membrane fusion protein